MLSDIYIGWNAQSCNWHWKIHSGTGQITANQTNAPWWECFQQKIFHKMLFWACLWYRFGCIMLSCELLPSGAKRFVWLLTILHLLESNSRFYFSKTWKLLYIWLCTTEVQQKTWALKFKTVYSTSTHQFPSFREIKKWITLRKV